MATGILDLSLPEETRRAVDAVTVRRCRQAVIGSLNRDRQLCLYDDQLNGMLWAGQNTPTQWAGGTQIDDPLTREAHLEYMALVTEAIRKSPKVQVEAINDEDQELATMFEKVIQDQEGQSNLQQALYSVAYTSGRDPVGNMRVGWVQKIRKARRTMFLAKGSDTPVYHDMREDGVAYAEVEQSYEAIHHQGCEFHVPDLADLYLYPADCQDTEQAVGIGERMLLTEDQLWDGVRDYGYEEDRVKDLINMGPTHDFDYREWRVRQDRADGENPYSADSTDGFYECFLWFGRLDKLRDAEGNPQLPEESQDIDYMCMVCPNRQIVFKCVPSPYPVRPYAQFYMIRKPNRYQGVGVPQLLDGMQAEANSNLQAWINSMNMQAAPVLIGSQEWITKYSKFKIYPGAVIPETFPNELRPLEFPGHANDFGVIQGLIKSRADGLIAAPGYGELTDKVRKNGEIQNVLQATNTKFSLFLQNFQMGLIGVAQRIVLYWLHFEQQSPMTLGELTSRFRFVPVATLQTATPEARLQLAQAQQASQLQYFGSMAQMPPQVWPFLWHGAREVLSAMGARQPEQWIGPEPQQPPPPPPVGVAPGMAGQPGVPGAGPPNPQLLPAILSQVASAGAGVHPEVGPNPSAGAIQR